jgi:colanic acid/amylovoran biosynthesis glycosyltransferase
MFNRMSKNLYFFTASFPFCQEESFIENEIPYLAKAFHKITIIPLYCYNRGSITRSTPNNCKVLHPVISNRWQHYFLGLFCIKTIRSYGKDFFNRRVYRNIKWMKVFLIDFCTTNNLLQSKALKNLLKEIQKEDIMYFYWGKGAANLLPFIFKIDAKKIVRFHAGDFNNGAYIPIQETILKEISIAVFISKHGQQYLKSKYPHLPFNSVVSYLGTTDKGVSKGSNDHIFRLLSCSSVIPIKRLFLLYEALQSITDFEIEWTHIGDGIDFEKLKKTTQKSRNNVKVNLPGRFSNSEVMMYYMTNMIDAFINVSSSEGIPVSLMEALSFNVPVIGTNVGGTSELITHETGILLSSNPTVTDIIDALKKITHLSIQPKLFWENKFNSAVNYPKFIDEILLSS